MSQPSHSLPLELWGNGWPRDSHALRRCVALCSVFKLVSMLQFPPPWHLRFCQRWLWCCFPTEVWGEAACQRWEELTVTHMHIIADTFIQCVLVNTLIFTLTAFLTFQHTHTPVSHMHHTTLVHNTAHSLRRCWWIRHLELADKERKWGRAAQKRKAGEKRGRIWKREKALVRRHAGRGKRSKSKRSRKPNGERCGEEEEDRDTEQRGQKEKCVKKKWDVGKTKCSQSHLLTVRVQ